jgi:Cupin-like domain
MKPATNYLKNRDAANIEEIECGFSSGLLSEAMAASPTIERRSRLTPGEFDEEYRKKGKPVVIEGLMDEWRSLKEWSFDYLAAKCSAAQVVVDSYTSKRTCRMTFAEFVAMLRAERGPDHMPLYLQEWLFMADCPSLADDLPELAIAQYDFRRNLYGDRISTNHQLWIGQKGATTRIHQDSYFIDVLHAQIVGAKHWCVMAPPAFLGRDVRGELDFRGLASHPDTGMMQCVLNPGEVLYLPAQWWHRIKLRSDSIGLGRKCLDEANLQQHIHMRLAELLPLALNHERVKQAYPELYEVVMLRNRAWARLLNIDLEKLRP